MLTFWPDLVFIFTSFLCCFVDTAEYITTTDNLSHLKSKHNKNWLVWEEHHVVVDHYDDDDDDDDVKEECEGVINAMVWSVSIVNSGPDWHHAAHVSPDTQSNTQPVDIWCQGIENAIPVNILVQTWFRLHLSVFKHFWED